MAETPHSIDTEIVSFVTTDDGERELLDDELSSSEDEELLAQVPAEARLLQRRQAALNSLFGFVPWKGGVAHKPMEAHSIKTRELYQDQKRPQNASSLWLPVGKCFWLVLFGWWLSLSYLIVAGLCALSYIALPYSSLLLTMAKFLLWPFDRFVVVSADPVAGETAPLIQSGEGDARRTPSDKVAYAIFVAFYSLLCVPLHSVAAFFCWESVVMIPMAKFNVKHFTAMYKYAPERLRLVRTPGPSDDIIYCNFRAANGAFYRYKVLGMNVILVNLLPFVLLTIILGYVLPAVGIPLNDGLMFALSLVATIPLTYYLGAALASLAAQTNAAWGAFLTATCGSLIELILYCTAIVSGGLERLVQASLIGSLLAPMLLLPGLAMIVGGIKYKEQRFNAVSAGVSSVLLITSIVGCFVPTIFYSLFRTYSFSCQDCSNVLRNATSYACTACTTFATELDSDPVYVNRARIMQYAIAAILPLVYLIGCVFTLKTHKHIFEVSFERELSGELKEEGTEGEAASGGHGHGHGAEWSIKVSLVVLIGCTALFAAIAEILTTVIQPVTESLGITQTFTGLTLIAIIPNLAELANACAFSLQDQIHLSVEIGNAVATQVALIQIPVLVIFSAIYFQGTAGGFTMIFPILEVFGVIVSVIIANYLSMDGRSNYFHGVALIAIYVILLVGFFFQPEVQFGLP